jgi:integrase
MAADDFSLKVKGALARRAAFQCAICGASTVGPSRESPQSVTNIGVAAHIAGARPGSARYRRALSPAQLLALLTAAPPLRRIVYLTAACTGLRRSELAALLWSDLSLEGSSPTVLARASITKNKKESVIPLPAELVAALVSYRPVKVVPTSSVFCSVPKVATLRRDLLAAEIDFLDARGRRADFHSLRMTYGMSLTNSGAAPRVVMELMRHSDIKLTMKIYTDAAQLPLAAAVAKLPPIGLIDVCPKTCPDVSRNVSKRGPQAVAAGRTGSQSRDDEPPNGPLQVAGPVAVSRVLSQSVNAVPI